MNDQRPADQLVRGFLRYIVNSAARRVVKAAEREISHVSQNSLFVLRILIPNLFSKCFVMRQYKLFNKY